jgi:hypothetical protein
MGSKTTNDNTQQGTILATTAIMQLVLALASEAEITALLREHKKSCDHLTMGHPQPATPVQTDNSTACSIANDNIKQQHSCAIDMRFYWIRDWVKQGKFNIYWGPGKCNMANYYTKHHLPTHHQLMWPSYLHVEPPEAAINSAIAYTLHALQVCAKPAPRNTMAPRVQGIQHMHTNTPAGQRAIASKAQATLSHARGSSCNYAQDTS